MGTPANPGWPTGYVPSATEWAQSYSGKVDYPAPLSQGGSGSTTVAGAAYNLSLRALVGVTAFPLLPMGNYGVQTGLGAFTLLLPSLDLLMPGDWIDVYDMDYNADVNNVTIEASGVDDIVLYATSAGTQTLDVAGVRVRLVVNAASWRMIV